MMRLSSFLLTLSSCRLSTAKSSRYAAASLISFIEPSLRLSVPIHQIKSTSALISSGASNRFSTLLHASSLNDYEVPIVSISDAYDSGNGEIVSAQVVNEDGVDVRVKVRIKEDP